MTLPAITIKNPWAWAIAEAAALTALGAEPKLVENRGRRIADKFIGHDIAIHAGLGWSKEGGRDGRVLRAWQTFAMGINLTKPNPLLAAIGDLRTGYVGSLRPERNNLWTDAGAVVAVARLADCHESAEVTSFVNCCSPWGDASYARGEQDARQPVRRAWHLVLADVRRLPKPVPARGLQPVPWTLPADVEAQVRAQLGQAAA